MADIVIKAVLELMGGLGIFLLGMHFMSEGLQTVAGPSLKKLIAAFTSNRLMGVGVGALVTAIIQSSSITTVMVVGFVNSGLMTLIQAVGVIMGANIGTTMTAWIMTLSVGKYGLQVAGLATFFYVFSKKEKVKYAALAILGIGLVFMGLEIMNHGLKPIRSVPEFTAWFQAFSADSYLGVLKCAAVGCILTMVVQSSSATLGITIAMATQGLISYETAAALVLGENVGTTITALLASIGASVNARRAAYFHAIFNLIGVFWVTAIFHWYVVLVEWLCVNFLGIANIHAVVMKNGLEMHPHVDVAIATTHSIFNITNTIIFLPLAGVFARFLERVVKERASKPRKTVLQLELGEQLFDTPIAAVEQTEFELVRMTKDIQDMMGDLRTALVNPEERKLLSRKVFDTEARMDRIQEELTSYLTKLLGQRVPESIAAEVERQLRLVDDLESVSDYATQILKLELRLEQNKVECSPEQRQALMSLHDQVSAIVPMFMKFLRQEDDGVLFQQITQSGQDVNNHVRDLRNRHWQNLAQNQQSPLVTTSFSDTLVAYRKIKEHLVTAAETHAGMR